MNPAYMASPPSPIELLILTGFLGSGKTTLLSAYLRQPQVVDVAVIVNEIGEIDLDGAVLSATAAKVPMALLSNGCVCCAVGGDLPGTIAMLIEKRATQGLPPLLRIVLETTGLARPGPILRSLQPLAAHLRSCVVSTFDLEHGPATLALPEAAAQIAGAQRIVLTKQDSANAVAVAAARGMLARINPLAELVADAAAESRAVAALAPLRERSLLLPRVPQASRDKEAASEAMEAGHSSIRAVLCRFRAPVAYEPLSEWLDNLAGAGGERLLRVKGLVRVRGEPRPMLVQCVGTVFSPIVPIDVHAPDSFLVVIVRDMSIDELRSVQPPLPFVLKAEVREQAESGRPLGIVLKEACA